MSTVSISVSCSDTDNAENSSPEKRPRRTDAKRRNLKTQAERRRRARINEHFQNLHDILHSTSLIDSSKQERCDPSIGTFQSLNASAIPAATSTCIASSGSAGVLSTQSNSDQRMEKAEILEKAVKRINLLESNLKTCESREERCYVTGFKHCAMQLYRFVESQGDLDDGSKQRICQTLLQRIRESNGETHAVPSGAKQARLAFQPATSSPIKRADLVVSSPKRFWPPDGKENVSGRRRLLYHDEPPGMKTLLLEDAEDSQGDSRLNASACFTSVRDSPDCKPVLPTPTPTSLVTAGNHNQLHLRLNGVRLTPKANFLDNKAMCGKNDENRSPARPAANAKHLGTLWRPW